jgi:amidase
MSNELWRLTAVEAVSRLKKKEISPLDLVEVSARRIEQVEPTVNAHADALPRPRARPREGG